MKLGAPSSLLANRSSLSRLLSLEERVTTAATTRLATVVQARRGLSELVKLKRGTADNSKRQLLKYKQYEVTPPNPVPSSIKKPSYVGSKRLPEWNNEPQVHNVEGIQRMRAAGRLAAQVLEYAGTLVQADITTDEIDRKVHQMVVDQGAYPSPLGYGTYPKSVCTSVNECICHGIPDMRPLQEGDIVNIDVTVYLNMRVAQGHHGDTSRMFYVGNVSPEARRLCETTERALHAAIAECKPGMPIKVIGDIIQGIADKAGYRVVRDFIGHGVGTEFHSYPNVFHFRNNEPGVLVPNMTFTIEPMLVDGNMQWNMWADDWTVVTKDGSLSAQYEHTLLVTEDGVEILTKL